MTNPQVTRLWCSSICQAIWIGEKVCSSGNYYCPAALCLIRSQGTMRLSSCTPEITKKPVIPSHPTLQGDVSMPTLKQGEFGLKFKFVQVKADDRRWRSSSPDMIWYFDRIYLKVLGSLMSGFEFIVRKKGSYFAVFHLRLRYWLWQ